MSRGQSPSVVFVVGSGRSGTTIVLDAIATLEHVLAVPRLAGRIPATTPVAALLARYGVGPAAWTRPSPESTALFTEAGLTQGFQANLGRSISPHDAGKLCMKRLDTRLSSIRRFGNAETVVVKNTASCARIPILATTFPECAFVHVLRHPSRVITSLLSADFWSEMTLWWDGRTTAQFARAEGLTSEEVAARHWAKQVGTLAADLVRFAESRSLLVRYEDFVRDPVATVLSMNRLGIDVREGPEFHRKLDQLQVRAETTTPISKAVSAAVAKECADVAATIGMTL